jgi:regulator of protease activity HflC (stomatin/prohibitin superfamily)
MNERKIILRTTIAVGAIVALMWIWTTALNMTNQKSDFAVGAGASIFILSTVGFILLMRRVFKKKTTAKQTVPPPIPVIILCLVSFLAAGCYKVVEPGYVGIKVNMSGDDRGVDQLPIETGRVSYNPFTQQVYAYPTFVQTAVWTHSLDEGKAVNEEITFTTQDQMQVAADISLAYHLIDKRVPYFYVKFRSDDLTAFTHGFMRNLAREKFDGIAGKYKIEQIMGDNLPFLTEVRVALQKDLALIGVEIDQFGLVGAPRPPPAVIEAINAKVGAVQNAIRAENEIRQAEAEAKKSIAYAKGQAESNQLLANSISPSLLEWRRLAINEKMIDKWNGVRPNVEAGAGTGFMFNIQPNK